VTDHQIFLVIQAIAATGIVGIAIGLIMLDYAGNPYWQAGIARRG